MRDVLLAGGATVGLLAVVVVTCAALWYWLEKDQGGLI